MTRGERATSRAWLDVLPVVALAVVLRLPVVLSRAPVNFDDGVYLASVGAMRAGGLPFRDVYSSQGPAFLPMLRIADWVGGQTVWAPRLLPLAAGVALVVVVHRLGLRVSDRAGAALAALLVAASGCVLFATDHIKSDGVAAALAAAAVLAAARAERRRDDLAAALLLGLGVAVKSLFVGPAALAVALLLLRRRGWQTVGAVALGAAAVAVALAALWGFTDVWDQYVRLHLTARGGGGVGDNLDLLRRLAHRDRLLLALGVVTVAGAGWRVARGRDPRRAEADDLTAALWVWLVTAGAVLLLQDPLFLQHLVVVVPPAALLIARARPPLPVVLVVALAFLPAHARGAEWRLTQPTPTSSEQTAIAQLRRITPTDGLVISDEPALPWLAGRTSPGSMVDLSHVRITAGDLTTADVAAAAQEPEVCAVLFWTGRLDALPGLRDQLPGYRSAFRDDQHQLFLREGCSLTGD